MRPAIRARDRVLAAPRLRIAVACGVAIAAAVGVRAWWEGLRRSAATSPETRRLAMRGAVVRAGPFAMFARVPLRQPERPRPPVVLVHGLVVSSRMVEPLAGALARHGVRVLAPDLPGFGESTKPRHPLDVAELVDALALWLQASGIRRATLAGTSFGCHVIVELAVRHPGLVDRLVLQGPGPDPAGRSLPVALWRQAINGRREPRSLGRIARIDYAKAGLRRAAATLRFALRERGSRDPIAPQA